MNTKAPLPPQRTEDMYVLARFARAGSMSTIASNAARSVEAHHWHGVSRSLRVIRLVTSGNRSGGAAMNIDKPFNQLLAALPVAAKQRLAPHLQFVVMAPGEWLLVADPPHYIHFPADAIIGVLQVLTNGAADGVFLVGNEGMVGVSYCLGGEISSNRAIVLKPGWAYRIPVSRILDEFRRDRAMLTLTMRYTQTRIAQASATLACNRYHSVRQQLSRFLLMYMERQAGNQLSVTQEVIARWLGVRRESVTEAASELRKLRVIDYRRGQITVLDKSRLEMLTCECYSAVRQETPNRMPIQSELGVTAPLRAGRRS